MGSTNIKMIISNCESIICDYNVAFNCNSHTFAYSRM